MAIERIVPAQPQLASTVVLIRQHMHGVQVYLLRRSSKSSFFPNTYVFPGGTVNNADRDALFWKLYLDMDAQSLHKQLGGRLTNEELITHILAAIRETFEEAGLLIARYREPNPDLLQDLCALRTRRDLPESWLRQLAISKAWSLGATMLGRWSHWITPENRPKRYDTRFFIAFPPSDQECLPDTRETTHGIWMNPAEAIARSLKGAIPLSPPTLVTLHELSLYSDILSLREQLQRHPWGDARSPRPVVNDQGVFLLLPWDPMYNNGKIEGIRGSIKVIPEPTHSFSRLWNDRGIWRPIIT